MNPNLNGRIRGLYAITPDEQDTTELLRKVRLAMLGGVRVLQYRNKLADQMSRLEQARELRKLTQEFDVPLIINDDAMLAKEVGADGVHLGGSDGSISSARAVLGNDKLIGMSCYNRIALAREAVSRGANYVAFGSFFLSAVKPNAVVATPDLLLQARSEIFLPLVAIGGITINNGPKLIEAGANALAVISALFSAKDIRGTAHQFANLNFL